LLQGNTLHAGSIYSFIFFGADPIILWAMKNLFISNTTHRASLWLVRVILPPTILLLVVVMAHGPPHSALRSLLLLHLVPTIPAIGEWCIQNVGRSFQFVNCSPRLILAR